MRILGILIFTAAMAMAQSTAATAKSVAELEARLAQLSKTLATTHPEMVAARKQLDEMKARMAELRAVEAQGKSQDAATETQQDRARALLRARQAESQALEAKRQAEQNQLRGQQNLSQLEQKLRQELDALKASSRVQANSETWWRSESMATTIGLSEAQVKRMDEVFQQARLKLIDQKAALEREEAILEPLIASEALDETRTTSQLDRVAQARAELEKTRGRLLVAIRKQMDGKQWRKLNEMSLSGSGLRKPPVVPPVIEYR